VPIYFGAKNFAKSCVHSRDI